MIERIRLYKNAALSLGASITATFEGVSGEVEGLTRKLLGIEVRLSGSHTQGSATAVEAKEELWGLLDTFSFTANGHTFCENMYGEELTQLNMRMGLLTNQNTDTWTSADFANDQNAHTFFDVRVFPCAPAAIVNIGGELTDKMIQGAFPVAALGSSASVKVSLLGTLTSAWALTSATYYTLEITALVLTDERKVAPAPIKYEVLTTSTNPAVFNREGAFMDCWFGSRTAATVVLPTGECSAKVSGIPLFDRMTGLALVGFADMNRPGDGVNDLIDTLTCPIIDILDARNAIDAPSGLSLEAYNVGEQSTPKDYMLLYHIKPTVSQYRLWLSAQGLGDAVGAELDLGRCYLDGRPVQGQGMTARSHIGATYVVR